MSRGQEAGWGEGRERCSGEMGSDESHFNVSLIVKGNCHKTVSTDHSF